LKPSSDIFYLKTSKFACDNANVRRYFMEKLYIICLILLSVSSCRGKNIYSDKKEYGYKGKVKVVIKRTYNTSTLHDSRYIPSDSSAISTDTYYFNEGGNIDSAKTERRLATGELYYYKRIFALNKSKKSGWTSFSATNEELLHGKIIWNALNVYTETVYTNQNKTTYEIRSTLNDSFRAVKIYIKGFDNLGQISQHDLQDFHLDKEQNTQLYKTTHLDNNSTEITNYEYLEIDKLGNPIKLLIKKKNNGTKTLVTIDYTFY